MNNFKPGDKVKIISEYTPNGNVGQIVEIEGISEIYPGKWVCNVLSPGLVGTIEDGALLKLSPGDEICIRGDRLQLIKKPNLQLISYLGVIQSC